MQLKISDITQETWDTKTFHFLDAEDDSIPFDYIAGQYLTFRYDNISDKPLVRSYTMSSAPKHDKTIDVTVKKVEGGIVSNWMCDELKKGDVLRARGPIGKFCYDPAIDKPHLVMVAAGSGVTPFVSILKDYAKTLGQEGSPKRMTLLVAYRSTQDLIAGEQLKRLSAIEGIKVIVTLTREQAPDASYVTGRPDKAMLEAYLGSDLSESTFMTCGPESMMQMVVDYLKENNVSSEQIKLESFA
jgi:ring-1,2-phenylacetyl-CoA epoxidase subunit PaaE